MNKIRFAVVALVVTIACPAILYGQHVFDFEGLRGLGADWSASGGVEIVRAESPAKSGNAAHLKSNGPFAFYSKSSDMITTVDEAEAISIRVLNISDQPAHIELLAIEEDRKALFWRKQEIVADTDWQTIEVPLRWFRWHHQRVPDWSRVRSVGFRGNAGVDIWVDDIQFVDRHPVEGAYATVDDYATLMTDGKPETCRRFTDDDLWLLTDSQKLDSQVLLTHLKQVRLRYRAEMPLDEALFDTPPKMFVFRNQQGYSDFVVRFGKQLNGVAPRPQGDGYHVQGLALSYYDERFGNIRPVFAHEFVHSMNSYYLRLDSSSSNWLQEGIANYYQVRFSPQAGLTNIIQRGLRDARRRLPLKQLTNGRNIPTGVYWQALTVVDFLMTNETVAEKWPSLLRRVRETGSVNLSEHAEPVYGRTVADLEGAWEKHVHQALGKFEGKF